MVRLACVAIGYIFGLFQTSYLYGRMNGIDIRDHGSGNAGTTNALRTLGKKAGAITFLGDCFKCFFAVLLVRALFGPSYPEERVLLGMYGALGVILGHNFPFYLKFRGGKGIAATAGLFLSLDPLLTLVALLTFVAAVALTRYVSLGSILVVVELLAGVILYGQLGKWGMTGAPLYELYALTAFLTLMALYRHRANMKRLLSGTERKIGERAK
ncbi:MAG: glycerol-3-phosphate 1-O-acyltransferase PlsY [Lachnospiraceae bacterium]|jgi:glycerol-3-phosphate acyltransferase PlsY|nr:glycerol-3-phosphate 1-O-acyltransferase PlsY [Lachnospiraceae bacterium]MCI9134829.1 glycerol-3-phosphate 1-O-acyltransferase PlsY [Lachnospiraceae bacterium]